MRIRRRIARGTRRSPYGLPVGRDPKGRGSVGWLPIGRLPVGRGSCSSGRGSCKPFHPRVVGLIKSRSGRIGRGVHRRSTGRGRSGAWTKRRSVRVVARGRNGCRWHPVGRRRYRIGRWRCGVGWRRCRVGGKGCCRERARCTAGGSRRVAGARRHTPGCGRWKGSLGQSRILDHQGQPNEYKETPSVLEP